MNKLRSTLLAFVFVGFFTGFAQAAEIQWATGCMSYQSPAIISVSYNSNTSRITLYRIWPATKTRKVDLYAAVKLNPQFSPTPFTSLHDQAELAIEFGTKNSFRLVEVDRQFDYYCAYYSFDTQ